MKEFDVWGDEPPQTEEEARAIIRAISATHTTEINQYAEGVASWRSRRLYEAEKILGMVCATCGAIRWVCDCPTTP